MNVKLSELLGNKIENILFKENKVYLNGDASLKIDFDIAVDELNIVANKGDNKIIEINPNYKKINIEVKQEASLKHCSILSSTKDSYTASLYCNALGIYNRFLIDLSTFSNKLDAKIELNAEGSEANYKSSIVTNDKTIKNHVVNIINNARHSIGNILNYGIVFGSSTLDITGIGDIKKGASVRDAHQKTVIVTFDKNSKGYARPFLFIGEDDVKASHDTSVGKIDEDILFYMTSRGIPSNVAKRYIALGYFKPIIEELNDEDTQNQITGYLEGVIK